MYFLSMWEVSPVSEWVNSQAGRNFCSLTQYQRPPDRHSETFPYYKSAYIFIIVDFIILSHLIPSDILIKKLVPKCMLQIQKNYELPILYVGSWTIEFDGQALVILAPSVIRCIIRMSHFVSFVHLTCEDMVLNVHAFFQGLSRKKMAKHSQFLWKRHYWSQKE